MHIDHDWLMVTITAAARSGEGKRARPLEKRGMNVGMGAGAD